MARALCYLETMSSRQDSTSASARNSSGQRIVHQIPTGFSQLLNPFSQQNGCDKHPHKRLNQEERLDLR